MAAGSYANVRAASNLSLNKEDLKKPFFNTVFEEVSKSANTPLVNKYYLQQGAIASISRPVLRLNNGDIILSQTPAQHGYLFTMSLPLDPSFSNITSHEFFVIILYRSALFKNADDPVFYTIGRDNHLQIPAAEGGFYHLVHNQLNIIPPQKMVNGRLNIFLEGLISQDGFYSLEKEGHALKTYAFNYDRKESVMQFKDPADLGSLSNLKMNVINPSQANIKAALTGLQSASNLWKWFIAAALVFLLAETLLIRFWK
jgi:hypothetical protein